MRKYLAFISLVVVVVCAPVSVWLAAYWDGLQPELVLTLPISECPDLSFGPYVPVDFGANVDALCKSNDIKATPIFALRGKKAVEFVPLRFHAVKGELKVTQADPHTVYFYRYNERYKLIIQAP